MGAGWKISDFVCGGLDSGLGRPGKSEPGDPTAYRAKNAPYFAPHERVRSRVAVSHPFAGFSRKNWRKDGAPSICGAAGAGSFLSKLAVRVRLPRMTALWRRNRFGPDQSHFSNLKPKHLSG